MGIIKLSVETHPQQFFQQQNPLNSTVILPSGEPSTQMLKQSSSVVISQSGSQNFLTPDMLNDSSNVGSIINDQTLQRSEIAYSDAKRIRLTDVGAGE